MDRSLSSARRPSVNGITQVTSGYGNNPTANGAALFRDRHFNGADETVSFFVSHLLYEYFLLMRTLNKILLAYCSFFFRVHFIRNGFKNS